MKDFLSDVPSDKVFKCVNGVVINNVNELSNLISQIDANIFSYHVNDVNDDFSNWIRDVVNSPGIASKLSGITNQKRYLKILKEEIKSFSNPILGKFSPCKNAKGLFCFLFSPQGALFVVMFLIIGTLILQNISLSEDLNEIIEVSNARQQDESKYYFTEIRNFSERVYLSIDKMETRIGSIEGKVNVKPQVPLVSPNIIDYNNIKIINNDITLSDNLSNLRLGVIGATSSMLPLLDENSNTLEYSPISPDEIQVGHIISFEKDNVILLHRVIKIGKDTKGWYAITRGDNLDKEDPGLVRFSDVKGLVIGLFY
jgi:hypothetical protein